MRVSPGHINVANKKGALCVPLTDLNSDKRSIVQGFEPEGVTEIVTIPPGPIRKPIRQRAGLMAPTFEQVDPLSPHATEALWVVGYDTGLDSKSRGGQTYMRFYLSATDAREIHRIAEETPQVLPLAMREATEEFVTTSVLEDSEAGKRAWEAERPLHDRWARDGIGGFVIRDSFDAGPEQSRVFAQQES
jgi:hypothetical protein